MDTLNKDSSEISPVAFPSPANHILVGATMVGKSFYMKKIILNSEFLFKHKPQKIYYIYEIYQDIFHELEERGVIFIQGCPSKEDIEAWARDERGHKLLIIDDQLINVIKSDDMAKLFTIYSHHLNFSTFFLKQTTFDKGKYSRMISLQTQYFHLFSNLRDYQNIVCLGKQIYAQNIALFLSAYKLATRELYRCLVVDLYPSAKTEYRLRTNIFDKHPIIYK